MSAFSAPQIRRVLADNIVRFINLFTYLLTYLVKLERDKPTNDGKKLHKYNLQLMPSDNQSINPGFLE